MPGRVSCWVYSDQNTVNKYTRVEWTNNCVYRHQKYVFKFEMLLKVIVAPNSKNQFLNIFYFKVISMGLYIL